MIKKTKILQQSVINIFLLIGCFLILFPLYLTVITALKTPQESAQNFFSLPKTFFLENFKEIINKANFLLYFKNSIVITVVSVTGEMLLLPLFAYVIARNIQSKYYKFIYFMTVLGIFIPFQVVMLPTIKLMYKINLLSTTGLIILYLTYTMKKGTFLFVGYLKSIPLELEESAYMDGCGILKTYILIVLPLLKPIIATMIIIDGLWIWNDFLLPLLMVNRDINSWTLPLFQFQFKNQYSFDFNLAFSSFLLTMLPIMLVYVFLQKHIIAGMTKGAIKG
ncbi:MAG: carbohydrate ABC transporter permease [Bacteroidetes bacterium]|nr:carbohydrate ABC transporter permease [Bacteroidota bacterium]